MVGSVMPNRDKYALKYLKLIIFSRMETVYRLLYSLIGVQWKCYNMIAEQNLLHLLMDREDVSTVLQQIMNILIVKRVGVHYYDLYHLLLRHRPCDVQQFWISHQISLREGQGTDNSIYLTILNI